MKVIDLAGNLDDIIVKKELASVAQSTPFERAVRESLPLREHLSMYMQCTASVISRENRYKTTRHVI